MRAVWGGRLVGVSSGFYTPPLPWLKDRQENEVSDPGQWQGAQTLMQKELNLLSS